MRFPRAGIKKEFWVGKAKRRRRKLMRLGKRERVEQVGIDDVKTVSGMVEMLKFGERVLMWFFGVWMRVGEVVFQFYLRF